MYSFHWTVKTVKPVGKLPVGAWVEIIKHTTSAKPTMVETFRAFEEKYGMSVPRVSDQYFRFIKD